MSRSLSRSTIETFQLSFWGFLAARPSSLATTSPTQIAVGRGGARGGGGAGRGRLCGGGRWSTRSLRGGRRGWLSLGLQAEFFEDAAKKAHGDPSFLIELDRASS